MKKALQAIGLVAALVSAAALVLIYLEDILVCAGQVKRRLTDSCSTRIYED